MTQTDGNKKESSLPSFESKPSLSATDNYERRNSGIFSIKFKSFLVLLFSIVPISFTIWFSYTKIRDIHIELHHESLQEVARHMMVMLTESLDDVHVVAEVIAKSPVVQEHIGPDHLKDCDRGIQNEETQRVHKNLRDFFGLFNDHYNFAETMFLRKGKITVSTNRENEGKDVHNAEYYIKGMAGDYRTNIYRSETTGSPTLIVAFPARLNGEVLGVIAVRIKPSQISEILRDITPKWKASSFLLNPDGLVLAGSAVSDEDVLRYKIDSEGFRKLKSRAGDTSRYISENGKEVIGGYSESPVYNWGILIEIDAEQAEAEVASIRSSAIIIGVIFVLLLALIIGSVIYSFNRSLSALLSSALKVGNGDLTAKAPVLSRDELGELSRVFNHMVDNLRSQISRAQEASIKITSSTNEILAATEQQVRSTSEEASQINQVQASINELSNNTRQVTESTEIMKNSSNSVLEASRMGSESARESHDGMRKINDTVQSMADKVLKLGERSQEIEDVLSVILNVADQTNLLSLNASIEAVKAGEAGIGFSVVAEEIRRLADQTASAAKSIAPLIKEIQGSINSVVMGIEEAVRSVNSGLVSADRGAEQFSQILKLADETAKQAQSIVAATRQQQIATNEASQSMSAISQAAKQTASGTRQASATAYELNALAAQLREGVVRFRMR